jgi:hypothetical protein
MKTIFALGLGALAMYFLDREQGPRRRALARERLVDLRNRAKGLAAEAQRTVQKTELEPDQPSDTPQSAHHLGR